MAVNLGFSRFADTIGDTTGTTNANGDYSITEAIFRVKPGFDEVFLLHRMLVTIEDTAVMSASEYGNTGAALANGIIIRLRDGNGVLENLTGDFPVTTNSQWTTFCYDVDLKTWGAGNELLGVRWVFTEGGDPIRLDGKRDDEFQIVLSDDFTGLITHKFLFQGVYEGILR
jgi:hypothetical protein